MKKKNGSYEPEYGVQDGPKIKTVDLLVGVKDRRLESKIKTAFTLAKSAGRELDLILAAGYSGQSTLRQRAAKPESD